jgi:hypothetical protein
MFAQSPADCPAFDAFEHQANGARTGRGQVDSDAEHPSVAGQESRLEDPGSGSLQFESSSDLRRAGVGRCGQPIVFMSSVELPCRLGRSPPTRKSPKHPPHSWLRLAAMRGRRFVCRRPSAVRRVRFAERRRAKTSRLSHKAAETRPDVGRTPSVRESAAGCERLGVLPYKEPKLSAPSGAIPARQAPVQNRPTGRASLRCRLRCAPARR